MPSLPAYTLRSVTGQKLIAQTAVLLLFLQIGDFSATAKGSESCMTTKALTKWLPSIETAQHHSTVAWSML